MATKKTTGKATTSKAAPEKKAAPVQAAPEKAAAKADAAVDTKPAAAAKPAAKPGLKPAADGGMLREITARPMMQGRNAALLALSYLGAERTMPNYNTMGLAKASLEAATRYLAFCLGPQGIRANAIAPGFIMTEMTDKLPDEVKEGWYKQIPLRRGGTPEDVAKVALFLASDLSSYVSGQVIHCCGAMNC